MVVSYQPMKRRKSSLKIYGHFILNSLPTLFITGTASTGAGQGGETSGVSLFYFLEACLNFCLTRSMLARIRWALFSFLYLFLLLQSCLGKGVPIKKDVVVVGAGLAGLAAARKLALHNISCAVFEAYPLSLFFTRIKVLLNSVPPTSCLTNSTKTRWRICIPSGLRWMRLHSP